MTTIKFSIIEIADALERLGGRGLPLGLSLRLLLFGWATARNGDLEDAIHAAERAYLFIIKSSDGEFLDPDRVVASLVTPGIYDDEALTPPGPCFDGGPCPFCELDAAVEHTEGVDGGDGPEEEMEEVGEEVEDINPHDASDQVVPDSDQVSDEPHPVEPPAAPSPPSDLSGERYSPEEDARLLKFDAMKMPQHKIGTLLGRSIPSIRTRIQRLRGKKKDRDRPKTPRPSRTFATATPDEPTPFKRAFNYLTANGYKIREVSINKYSVASGNGEKDSRDDLTPNGLIVFANNKLVRAGHPPIEMPMA